MMEMKITHFDRDLTADARAHLQETADSLGITIWVGSDGRPYHLKMGQEAPRDAEIFRPARPYEPAPHGAEPAPAAAAPDSSIP